MTVDLNNLDPIFAALKAPFDPEEIEWKIQRTNKDRTSGLVLAYLTSRALMDRLDEVIGPENWKDEYTKGPDGGVLCGISLRIGGEWITKWDGAPNTNYEAVKGGLSDAFKRAGYKWGIGRYLYKLPGMWVKCEPVGEKGAKMLETPGFPSWALPDGYKPTPRASKKTTKPADPKPADPKPADPKKSGAPTTSGSGLDKELAKMTVGQASKMQTPNGNEIGGLTDDQLRVLISSDSKSVTPQMKHAAALVAKSRHLEKEATSPPTPIGE